ncbi:hypothetical protein [Ensifer sp. 22460]|uniref:hypothetical protein n=1 Tax=Ensifer sp. 22460 TaxID=3453922 RepID=UPI003F8411D5
MNGTLFDLAVSYRERETLLSRGEAPKFGMIGFNTGAISTEAPIAGIKQSGLGAKALSSAWRNTRR